ncbi:MAG: helix-turn-helix domain-containing protein [Mycobacteriales bacterium]
MPADVSDNDLPAPMTSLPFLTLDQVAVELNVFRAQVYALVRARRLLAVKFGGRGHWRVERSELEALHRPAVRGDPSYGHR